VAFPSGPERAFMPSEIEKVTLLAGMMTAIGPRGMP